MQFFMLMVFGRVSCLDMAASEMMRLGMMLHQHRLACMDGKPRSGFYEFQRATKQLIHCGGLSECRNYADFCVLVAMAKTVAEEWYGDEALIVQDCVDFLQTNVPSDEHLAGFVRRICPTVPLENSRKDSLYKRFLCEAVQAVFDLRYPGPALLKEMKNLPSDVIGKLDLDRRIEDK